MLVILSLADKEKEINMIQVFLFMIVYIPLLSLSLMTSPHIYGENRNEIAPKNTSSIPKRFIRRAVIYFSINFLPSLMVVCLIYHSTVSLSSSVEF